jgi:Tfp pilus assembly PilM family ATPase
VVRDVKPQLQTENYIQTILLAGGAANLPGIQDIFTEVFPGIPVQMGNPWTNIISQGNNKTPPLSAQDASHFATALGLALRQEEGV